MGMTHERSLEYSVTDLAVASPTPTENQIRFALYRNEGTSVLCSADLVSPPCFLPGVLAPEY